jgi:hypothetical protein
VWVVVYLGLIVGATGLVRSLFARRWRRGFWRRVTGVGLALTLVGALLPAPERTVPLTDRLLDRATPTFEFSEFHSAEVDASCERAFDAVLAVTAPEIRGFGLLTWIRRMGRPGPEDILNAPAEKPLLTVATSTTFRELGRRPGREIVIATVLAPPAGAVLLSGDPGGFRELATPGVAKAAMSVAMQPLDAGRCHLTTETRVHATDASTRRRFAAYWRLIYPGSALIRRMWLRAVVRRAMQPAS